MTEGELLHLAVGLGSFRFSESYALSDEPMGTTRLSLSISARNSVAMLGGELDRFDVRRLVTERVGSTLERVQLWCEGESNPRRGGARPPVRSPAPPT